MVKRELSGESQPSDQKPKKIRLTNNPIHHFFKYSGEDKISYCTVGECNEGIKGKNTTNLEHHLKRRHCEKYSEFLKLAEDTAKQQL